MAKLGKRDNTHEKRLAFAQEVFDAVGSVVVQRKDLLDFVEQKGCKWPSWLVVDKQYRVSRGVYRLPLDIKGTTVEASIGDDLMLVNDETTETVDAPDTDGLVQLVINNRLV